MDYRMKAEPGHLKLTGGDVRLIHTVTRKTVQKNWRLVVLYLVVTLIGIVTSYYTSEWFSVAATIFFSILTFAIGYLMLTKAIEITREIR